MKRKVINVISDVDLLEFLNTEGLYQDFIDEKIHCYKCDEIITKENIFSLFFDNDQIRFCCMKAICAHNI